MTAAVPTDEIYERYLRKAIGEINELQAELLALADETHVPVLGSGHPLADIFLLKHAPQPAEITEGVAFFGRAGNALLKSLQRLGVDPLAIYGTNCLKFGTEDDEQATPWLDAGAPHRAAEAPRRDGRRTPSGSSTRSRSRSPIRSPSASRGSCVRFTPTIEAIVTPDIDAALDDQAAKTAFWDAFKALGPWWAQLPPY